jgi:hypothetical protein
MPVKKAQKTKKPLKILIYGQSGVGKTHFALFATPGQTLVFDMEGGTDLFEGRVDFDFWTDDEGYKTQSYRELRKCIDYLKTPEGRQYKTFIVDPVTLIWTLLQQERQDYKEGRVTRQKANETDLETFTTRDWNIVKKMHKGAIDELSALPQNVILVAREKDVVEMKNGEPVKTGEFTYEGEKNTIYAVDFALRLVVDKKSRKRVVIIDKDRSGHYETGSVIPDPSFELFNEIVNGMADGTETKGLKTGSDHLFEQPVAAPPTRPSNEQRRSNGGQGGVGTQTVDEGKIKNLHIMGNKKGLAHEDIHHLAETKFGVASLKDMTLPQFQELFASIQKMPAQQAV